MARSAGMLSNENFLSKAPEDKIRAEKEKYEKYAGMMKEVEDRLAVLSR